LADEEVVVQLGHHPDPPRRCRWVRWLPFPDLVSAVREARVVVAHAGAGTILTCNDVGRRPIVLAREMERGEHLDGHQCQLARRMAALERVVLTHSPEETLDAILRHDPEHAQLTPEPGRVPDLAVSLAQYIDAFDG
jgi:UDP-N-acetylglucosamine transferase subunit ALG13